MSSPIIFEKGTRDFSTLGLGLLSDAIQATTTEELNGQFIFEMDYPVSGNNADLIRENRIIVVNSGHILKRQGFIIRQIVRKIDLTMTVYAEHVSYATLDVALAPMGTISGDAKTALENWKRMLVPAVDFTVDSDILTTNSTSIGAPEFETARQGLGGHAGSILDVWGGEYQFDNWHIRLLKQRGKSANAIIAYGRNLISFEQDTNIADTYTSVYPYYQENSGDDGNKTHFLPERTVDSEFVGKYPNPKVLMLDLSNKFKDVADYSETKLKNYALSYIQSNNIGVPKVNMKISTVDLSRATGGFSEDIDLGDTVNVYFEKLGVTTSAKVIKAVWNVLSDDYDKFEIGARRSSLTESVSELATTADENANKALNQALVALQSADGKTTIYYLDSSDPWPTNPKENDTAFVKDGENSIMYRYMFNNDTGMFSWVKILDSMSADQIKQRVSDALESGKAYSDQLVADNVAQVNTVISDVQAKQADLSAQQAELDTKAQGYANKALADAKDDTLATATQTAKDASDALAKAKTDLTTSLNKEVTDRANAVTSLDTKAKGYADTAKADALNTIAKEVTDRQNAVSALDTKATNAVNQAKSDINATINALSTGDRNYILDTGNPKMQTSNGNNNQDLYNKANFYSPIKNWGVANGDYIISFDWTLKTALAADMQASIIFNQSPWQEQIFTVPAGQLKGHVDLKFKLNPSMLTVTNDVTSLTFRINSQMASGNTITYSNLFMKSGTIITTWTQAPEDVVLDYTTKDNQIKTTITQYQTTNDGKVIKAQTDATTALGLVATKVSQTDYDQKTGDLSTKYTQVKQTVDSQATDIADIKATATSQASKINSISSDVDGTKQSISDIETTQDSQSDKINQITSDVNGTKQSISYIQTKDGQQDTRMGTIETSVSGVKSDFSSYKTTNDGAVQTAQTTAQTAVDGLKNKVSQTDYNTKTGQLQTDLNTTTATANTSKQDIVAIKSDNTKQDARMTTIESDANGVKTTVSNLQTDLGKANGSITTLQQRADGFDATVTKINNLSVGGRNLLLHTNTNSYSTLNSGNGQYTTKYVPFDGGYKYQFTYTTASTNWAVYQFWGFVKEKYEPDTDYVLSFMANFSVPVTPSVLFANGASGNNFVQQKTTPTVPSGSDKRVVIQLHTNATIPTASDQSLYMGNFQRGGAGTFTIWDLKIEKGNLASSYTPAPEDVDSATARAQLTADQATTSLNTYKTDADGRISKAQADIIVNASAITQKVSQSDYNAKTGDLTTKVNTAQSTADSATSTIGAYKTSNDARVASAESKITANANAITSKVSQSDYNTKTGQIDGQISSIKQTATSISQSVADVMTQVNNLQQVNLINNSDFRPDLSGWSVQSPSSGTVTTGDYDYAGNVMVLNNTAGGMLRVNSVPITLTGTTTVSYTFNYYIFGLPAGGTVYSQLTYLDSAMKEISGSYPGIVNLATTPVGSWQKRTVSNLGITPPTGATYIVFSFDVRGAGTKAGINRPILVKGGTVGDYVPGQYTNNDKISTVSQTVDSISSIVSDPTTGLTKRVQTAEGSISTVQSNVSDLQSKQTQTASGLTTEISNRQTGDTNTLTQAKDFTTSSISNSESGMRSQITQTSDAIIAQVNSINMVANSEFDPVGKGWYQVLPTTGSIVGSELAPGSLTTSFGDWPEAGGSQLVRYDSGSWYASEPRQASSGKQYSASIVAGRTNLTTSVALDLRILWLDSSKKVVGYSSAENIINTASYTGLKLYKLENQTSPANTAFVSIAIAHSGATSGGYDVVGRPMLNIGSKVGTYSPTYAGTASTTQLALLKDNWSIGIADNAGAITNGIVGNSTNMSLISNNVVINAPSTQIKGTAWINSAMIGNGQIGTAQIGDASITSAKIMNLDVNKITGNVSNWVLSQWTSATGSKVTIDGNGLYFSPGTSRMTTYGFEAWRRESSGNYAAMGMLGSYAWETDQDINGVGLIAKYYGVPHDDPNGPWKNEVWGGDTIAIGALEPQIGRGYNYVTPYMIFPSSSGIGEKYFPGNGNDTIIMSRWLSIYTGLNMRGHSIVNSSGYSLKENFSPVSGSDALDIFDNTEIMTYDYKPDSDDIDARTLANMQDKVGFVINDNGESPFKTDPRLVRYGNTRDDSVTVGYLMAAVKELHAKVKELETQLGK